jgi:hypothetical protein
VEVYIRLAQVVALEYATLEVALVEPTVVLVEEVSRLEALWGLPM